MNDRRNESEMRNAVSVMAEKLELKDSMNKMPSELSGGMAHRTALGRALLPGGSLLMLDEPMRGLNSDLRDRILANIDHDIRFDRNGNMRTVIMITHDEDLAEKVCDRKISLK